MSSCSDQYWHSFELSGDTSKNTCWSLIKFILKKLVYLKITIKNLFGLIPCNKNINNNSKKIIRK